MKFNQWTLGLAAVGAVSLASAVSADEAKLSALQTAVSSTTISGVVDVGYMQQLGDVRQGNWHYTRNSATFFAPNYGVGKYASGFSLNQVIISLDKALDESKWASGYHVDLQYGDSVTSDSPIRQAYVALRTPVGNGIDWKVGIMDGVTGYEGNTLSANPNYTRSYGYMVNPATFVGIIGQYKFTDLISMQAGFVNRNEYYGSSDNKLQSHDYLATVTLTAPESFGFLKGSTVNLQTVQGFDNESTSLYSANATLNTPVAGLKVGFSYDRVQGVAWNGLDGNIFGVYASYQATDKLGFALRGEYVDAPDLQLVGGQTYSMSYVRGEEVTATVSYNLWANVLTRLEFRWDHAEQGTPYLGSGYAYKNAFALFANIAYKF